MNSYIVLLLYLYSMVLNGVSLSIYDCDMIWLSVCLIVYGKLDNTKLLLIYSHCIADRMDGRIPYPIYSIR